MKKVMFKYGGPSNLVAVMMEYEDDATYEDIEMDFKEWLFKKANGNWWVIKHVGSE